jgi:hypothetical protein
MVDSDVRAEVDTHNGNYWLQQCTSNQVSEKILCVTYLMAVLDYNTALDWSNTWRPFCPPDNVTVGQMQAIVIEELRENPAKLHEPFVFITLNALNKAFPCQSAPQASTR